MFDFDKKYPSYPIDKDAFISITESFQPVGGLSRLGLSKAIAEWLVEHRPYYDVVKGKTFDELEFEIHYLLNHG
ncbi:MAG: hypothetical protein K5920_02665 [Bacteroidales bacterium]|nr:hypothetical protein [Bacteroidales bacterium]